MAALQQAVTHSVKKRLWQALVVAKIDNQAACLGACGRDAAAVAAMAKLVGSGDPDNVEARAARAYWGLLFERFIRSDESDLRNKMLNYGYAVLRAAIARALVACGLLPCFGLHHDSAANAFNLADDLFEPFRPIVDLKVFRMTAGGSVAKGDLSLEQRRELAALLNADVRLGADTVSTLIATERAAEALLRAMEAGSPALLSLPSL